MSTENLSMPTKYEPTTVEKGRYEWWLKGKYFEAQPESDKEPYTIVIPPPNVTGKLHLGHAWDTTLQSNRDRLLGVFRAMLAFTNVVHFLADKFTGLGRSRLTFRLIPFCAFECLFFWHVEKDARRQQSRCPLSFRAFVILSEAKNPHRFSAPISSTPHLIQHGKGERRRKAHAIFRLLLPENCR